MRKKISAEYIFLILLLTVIALLPLFVKSNYFYSIMIFMGINAIMVIGIFLLWGCADLINVAPAAFYGLGAYISGIMTTKLEMSPWISMLCSISLVTITAYVLGLLTLDFEIIYLAIATLAFGVIVNVLFMEIDFLTGGAMGLGNIPHLSIAGFLFNSDLRNYYLVWAFVAIIFLFSQNLAKSRIGRAFIALGDDAIAAETLGVNVVSLRIKVFILSCIYCSISGSLYAHYITFLSPSVFGIDFSILLLVMIIIGGMRNIMGAMIGVGIMGFLPEILRSYKEYDALIYAAIMILVMMFFPEGLFGAIKKLIESNRSVSSKPAGCNLPGT